MAEFIGPTLENKNIQRRGIASLGRPLGEAEPTESKAIKATLAAFSLLEEEDQDVAYNIFDGVLKLNVINDNESLVKIKASELAAEKVGYDGDIPVNLDDKTLFKIALDTKDKLPNDIRLKVDTLTNLVGDKELENAELIAGNLGINFDGENAVGNYNYNNGKLNIRPSVTKTDDNIQTDSNLQYLLDEDTVNIFTSQGPIKLPKESLTVNINTDKLYDEKSGTVSYVKRKDDGSKKANIYLNTVAKNNEPENVDLSFDYITNKGIGFSGSTYQDLEGDMSQNQIGVTLPITNYANLEASKSKGDFVDDNNLRLNVGKNFNFPGGGNLNVGGYLDNKGDYQAGINYKLAFGAKPEPKGMSYSTNDPKEALSFLQNRFKKGGRVKMFKGGLAGILKV
tara:strand:+ start:178 stop:1365 length:1188 start_codon:yes stop_codon:yes gene_type:complete